MSDAAHRDPARAIAIAISFVLLALLGVGCASSSVTSVDPTAGTRDEPNPSTGSSEAGATNRAEPSTDASTTEQDASTGSTDACSSLVAAVPGCQFEVGAEPSPTGGTPPDGIYDRKAVISSTSMSNPSCGASSIRLDQGNFQLVFYGGSPPVQAIAGTYTLDQAANEMLFEASCTAGTGGSNGHPSAGYSWDASEGTLTLFFAGERPGVYRLR